MTGPLRKDSMQLYIGNKNYSSWSLRAWLLMRHSGIAFEEVKLQLDEKQSSALKRAIAAVSPAGRVPAPVGEGFAVWDTLATAEHRHEKYPAPHLRPQAAPA